MIRFACPKCDTSLKSTDDTAGTTTACPRCGERFEVPAAVPEKEKAADRKQRNGDSKTTPIRKPAGAAKKGAKRDSRDGGGSKTPVVAFVGIGIAAIAIIAVVGVLLLTKKPIESVVSATNPATTPVVPSTGPSASTAQTGTQASAEAKPTPPPPMKGSLGYKVYQQLLKSTVFIHGERKELAWMGSGSLIDKKNKLILTNFHVVMYHDKAQMHVFFPDYENGELVADKPLYLRGLAKGQRGILCHPVHFDPAHDLALIRLDGEIPADAQPITLAHASAKPGDTVHSMGNPGGSDSCWVYTDGSVRSVYRKAWTAGDGIGNFMNIDSWILETQSPTNHGDSGGPMVNDNGELVAVTEGGTRVADLINFFIDVREVKAQARIYYKTNNMAENLTIAAGRSLASDLGGLINDLDDADFQKRRDTAERLGQIGQDARKANDALVKHLKDTDEYMRRNCAQAIEQIGGLSASQLKPVIEALQDSNVDVRKACAGAIGRMDANGEPGAQPLADLLKDAEVVVRKAAVVALGKIGPPAKVAVAQLGKALKDDKDADVRAEAARALGKMGSEAGPAVKDMAEALTREKNTDVRVATLATIENLGPDARDAVPALTGLLKERDPEIRRRAIAACRAIRQDAQAAAPALASLLEQPEVRDEARGALVEIGKSAVDALREMLKSKKWEVREASCKALGDIGPDAKGAVPELEVMIKQDMSTRAKKAATSALKKIQGK